ncbi:MAG: hypothetical protein PVJ39_07855 [Gammaproteobacteria bacterium]|jgi:hypothetical protein
MSKPMNSSFLAELYNFKLKTRSYIDVLERYGSGVRKSNCRDLLIIMLETLRLTLIRNIQYERKAKEDHSTEWQLYYKLRSLYINDVIKLLEKRIRNLGGNVFLFQHDRNPVQYIDEVSVIDSNYISQENAIAHSLTLNIVNKIINTVKDYDEKSLKLLDNIKKQEAKQLKMYTNKAA